MTCERCEFIETEYVQAEAEDLTRDALLLALAAARVERTRLREATQECEQWRAVAEKAMDASSEGAWMARALDAEREAKRLRLHCQSHQADLDSARAEGVRLRLLNERMLQCITGFVEAVEAAEAHATRPKGGQQVTFSGDFASAVPSVRGQLRWWARHLSQSTQEEL